MFAAIGERMRQVAFEIGLDLRGEPRVKRGVPPVLIGSVLALAAWAAVAALFADRCPRDLRTWAIHGSYVFYLALIAAIWISAIILSLLAAFLTWAMWHDAFVAAHATEGPRPRHRERAAILVYFVFVMLLGMTFPVGVSLVACWIFLVAYLVICRLPNRISVQFLWRRSGTVRVRSLSWSDWVSWQFALIALAVFALVLTTCGDRLWGAPYVYETMPLTAMLGTALAWLAPGALGALLVQMALGRWRDPARPARPIASISGVKLQSRQSALLSIFSVRGWRLLFGKRLGAGLDVPLQFIPDAVLGGRDEPRWPLIVAAGDFDDPALWERMSRRNEIQLRRRLLTALERMFKLAAGRARRFGSGYWLAPHFWFIPGLMRDSQREADDDLDFTDRALLSGAIGPPYYRFLPRPVRHHAWEVLRALQIDLIFVEDGVGFRRLRRVLRVLFEVFDIHGGRRPAAEIDFRGLPGIRVLFHDFQFDEPFKSELYPEPKYDFLGRARILHVFRDRGGHEELIEPPFDTSRSPAPVAVG
jgi:hypothetical protein